MGTNRLEHWAEQAEVWHGTESNKYKNIIGVVESYFDSMSDKKDALISINNIYNKSGYIHVL